MLKLDFICIGAQKSGTTSLHDILASHPEIYLPPSKEAHFFNVDEFYDEGIKFYFKKYFTTYKGEKFVGNINPNIHVDNNYIRRIINSFDNEIKIIFIIRDPVKRAYSHYLMSKRRGFEEESFDKALELENERLSSTKIHKGYKSKVPGHFEQNHFSYVKRGLYSDTLQYIIDNFQKKSIKIILFEDFISNIPNQTNEILSFLNIEQSNKLDFNMISNEAFIPKNKTVRNLIGKHTTWKSILGKTFGVNTKKRIKSVIEGLNKQKLTEKEKKLSKKEMHDIYQRYFLKDINQVEKILKKNLDNWKH